MKKYFSLFFVAALVMGCNSGEKASDNNIDRKALLGRHNPHVEAIDSLAPMTVGNGGFAFTVDITGLQTFPERYKGGLCLTTQSDWGWYAEPNYLNVKPKDCLDKKGYAVPPKKGDAKDACDYYQQNPRRMNLGRIGFTGLDADLLSDADQTLDLYNGTLQSNFKYNGKPVQVTTSCDPELDMLAVSISCEDLLPVQLSFSYHSFEAEGDGGSWEPGDCVTELTSDGQCARISVKNHISRYFLSLNLKDAYIRQPAYNVYEIVPMKSSWSFTGQFRKERGEIKNDNSAASSLQATKAYWNSYWEQAGAVDLSACTDPRAAELERRIVLSQYLTAVQCAGSTPASSTGLSGNVNYGKFRMDELWWNEAHFALWGHPEMLNGTMDWFAENVASAEDAAYKQGYLGARWPSVSSNSGVETPSESDVYQICQQASVVYLYELMRRAGYETLEPVLEAIKKTGMFMVRVASEDKNGNYNLVCQPLQKALGKDALNPSYELAAWFSALSMMANIESGNFRYLLVARDLNKPAVSPEGVYLPAYNVKKAYESKELTSGHPSVLGMFGMLPGNAAVDTLTMKKTLDKVIECWDWNSCSASDLAMAAMCATRLGEPEKAIELLLKQSDNSKWLAGGQNSLSGQNCYLTGNGALLSAVALMTAGWDKCESDAPGFPKDGKWDVKWEKINPLP